MGRSVSDPPFCRADLIEAPLVAAAFERSLEPERHDLRGKARRHDASAHRQYVGIVVLPRQTRGIQFVAQRRPDAGDLVGGYLFALAASPEDMAAVGAGGGPRPRDGEADGRVVDGRLAVGSKVLDRVSQALDRPFQVLLEEKSRVVRANRDAHARDCTMGLTGFPMMS